MHIPLLAYIAAFASAFPALFGFLRWKILARDLKVILAVFSFNVLCIALQLVLNLQGQNNRWISHIYGLVEFTGFWFVFSQWVEKPNLRVILKTGIVLYILFWIISKVFLEKFDHQPFYTSLLARILFTAISIYILHMLSSELTVIIYRDARFWIAAGMLIAASGGLMFYALRNVIDQLPREGLKVAYSVHWIIIILSNVLYSGAFLCKAQPQNSGGQLELAQ